MNQTNELPTTGQVLEQIVNMTEAWYKQDQTSNVWPYNEIAYAATGILKEVAQKLNGGNYDPDYIKEKCRGILNAQEHTGDKEAWK